MSFLKFVSRMMVVAILFVGVNALAFTEGVDYVKLDKPIPNADKSLIKVFSYDCPFCYKYDKSVTPKVVQNLDGVVKFESFHLKTKGKYGPQASELLAVLLVKDMDNGITNPFDDKSQFKKAKMAYYAAYHDKKERWDAGVDSFLDVGLKAAGISKSDFEATKNDQRVKDLLNKWDASYEVAKIQGVPAFVVNGKYLIYTKTIRSIDGMTKLVKELANK